MGTTTVFLRARGYCRLGGPMRRSIPFIFLPIFIMVCSVATMFSQSVPPVSFRVAPIYGAGSGPVFVALGDFNGDGKPDLAVANQFSVIISVFVGSGDGTFQSAVN